MPQLLHAQVSLHTHRPAGGKPSVGGGGGGLGGHVEDVTLDVAEQHVERL